jgi:hypothetical protein
MLQTTSPPPTNVDAAAVIAANASAIPSSPGGTPIAAIAAAIIANASTIAASPGGMPFTAMGLNIGGAKPLVLFAPPGVSGGQHNLDFSASSQPTSQSNSGSSANLVGGFGATHPGGTSTTTQSNLGFSAGSVGRLGATCLGSTNTITGTLGSNHVLRKKGNSLILSPYSGSIDPLSLTGIAKYINFVKSLYNERLDCSVANHNLIFAGLAKKAKQYSMAILRVPTSSTDKMAGASLTINTISLANVDLGSYVNILSKHTTKLTKDQLCAYSSWFFCAEDEPLAMRKTPSNMVACLVNLEATGNQGLVANCKVELCRERVMLYHFLVNLLKTTKMTCYCMDQEEYTYIQEGDPTIEHFCGLNPSAMMRKEIWPQTKVSTNNLETKLSEITFAACNTSVPTFITKMLDIKHQIEAEKGVTYEPNHFMTLLFDKLSGYNNNFFCYEFIAARSAYNKGKMTHDKVFETLKLVYRTEQAAGTWADLMPSKFEITMLTTNLANANAKLHKMKASGGGGSRGSGGSMGGSGGRGSSPGRGNCNHATKKSSGSTNDKDCERMLTRTTNTIKHPTKGYDMKWCKLCGPGPFQGDPRRHVHAHTPRSCKMAPLQEGVTGKFQCQKEISKIQKI